MTISFRPISISLIPNYTFSDVWRSFGLFLQPGNYFNDRWNGQLEEKIKKYLGRKDVILFESGRTAQYFLLKGLGIGPGDEVIIQAFTCVAVPNSVLWTGAKPVYCDIDESLNMDPDKLGKLMTKKTKAVIVQHTFGSPAQVEKIKKICERYRVPLIEDLAHGLGGQYEGKKLGTLGRAAFLSFGRDKVISGIWGGAVVTDSLSLSLSLWRLVENLPTRGRVWVAQQLLYAPLVYFILSTYTLFNLGKAIHWLLHSLSLLTRVLTVEEKEGMKQEAFYRGVPGALAALTLAQLENLDNFIAHRRELAWYYSQELGTAYGERSAYLRYSVEVADLDGLRRFAAKRNVFLGDWYDSVVAPKGVDLKKVGYVAGSCPKAEEVVRGVVNLPTNPNLSLEQAAKVVQIVKEWKLKK